MAGLTGKLGVVAVGKLGVVALLRVPTFVGEPSGSRGCMPGPMGLRLKRSSSTVREVLGVAAYDCPYKATCPNITNR